MIYRVVHGNYGDTGLGSWFSDQGGWTQFFKEFVDIGISDADFLADWIYGKDKSANANQVLKPMPITTKTPNTADGLKNMTPDSTAVTAADLEEWRASQRAAIVADEKNKAAAANADSQQTWLFLGLAAVVGVGVLVSVVKR